MKIAELIIMLGIVLITVEFSGCNKNEEGDITCNITQPQERDTFVFGSTVSIVAEADYAKGTIAETRFFVDGIGVSSSKELPFKYDWEANNVEIGWHTIKIEAKGNNGVTGIDEKRILLIDDSVTIAKIGFKDTIIGGVDSLTISANEPEYGYEKRCWTVREGEGGSFADSTKANTVFTGKSGKTYTLRWTISNIYSSSFDEVNVIFKKIEYGGVTDVDGNTYKTVTISNQEWMAENLKVTHYPDGSNINLVTIDSTWKNLQYDDSAYCFYDNNENSEYGALYTYAAAINVCPDGWHLPSDEEWTELEDYISNDVYEGQEGTVLKSVSGWDYNSPVEGRISGNGNDLYGFSALPGGFRHYFEGRFQFVNQIGIWWSCNTEDNSNKAYSIDMDLKYSGVYHSFIDKSNGYSVRCIKDSK